MMRTFLVVVFLLILVTKIVHSRVVGLSSGAQFVLEEFIVNFVTQRSAQRLHDTTQHYNV
jgi:hypothetical protein